MLLATDDDPMAPFTDLAVEIIGGTILAIAALLWAWWRWGPRKRLELNTPDRLELANKLAAAARQVEILADHDQRLTASGSVDESWPKIQRCLDIMREIGQGPAAKIATGNAGGSLSKNESRMAMLMVGSTTRLAESYALGLANVRTSESAEGIKVAPCFLGLDQWAELFRFSAKIFDPTRRTGFGLWRLERRLKKRLKRENESALAAIEEINRAKQSSA